MPYFRQQTILPIRDHPPESESVDTDRGDGGCGCGLYLPAPQAPIPVPLNDGHNGTTHHSSGRTDRPTLSSLNRS